MPRRLARRLPMRRAIPRRLSAAAADVEGAIPRRLRLRPDLRRAMPRRLSRRLPMLRRAMPRRLRRRLPIRGEVEAATADRGGRRRLPMSRGRHWRG